MDRRYDVLTVGRAFVEGPGASRWHGTTVMRISVSGWQTTAADADRSADAVLVALGAALA